MPKVRQTDPLEGTRFERSLPLWDCRVTYGCGRCGSHKVSTVAPMTLRFPSTTSSSCEHCEDRSTDCGNLLRGRENGKKRDYIGEFVLIDIPERKCGFCEDIADV